MEYLNCFTSLKPTEFVSNVVLSSQYQRKYLLPTRLCDFIADVCDWLYTNQ